MVRDSKGRIGVSRRRVLKGSSAGIAAGIAGCLGGSGADSIEVVTHLDAPTEKEALESHAEAFEEDTGTAVELTYAGPDELVEMTGRRVRGGNPPDVVTTALSNIGHLVTEGALADLSDLKNEIEDEHGDVADKYWVQYDGDTVIVPVGLNAHNLTIRQDMVEEAGFTMPGPTDQARIDYSWETHKEWMQGIQDEVGVAGMGIASGSTVKGTNDAIGLLWNHGVDIWSGDSPQNIELTMDKGENRERTIDMLENVDELLQNGATTQAGWSWGEMITEWSQETIASQIYSVGRLMQITRENLPDLRHEVQPISVPSYQGRARSDGAKMHGSILVAPAVFKDSDNVDTGREWIRHFVSHRGSIDVITAAAFHAWPAFPERRESDIYLEHEVVAEREDVRNYQEMQEEYVQARVLTADGAFNPWVLTAWTEGTLGNLIARMEVEDMSPEESLDATVEELMDNKPDSIN